MKANEFVKKHGWGRVKHCLTPSSRDNFFIVGGDAIRDRDLQDLKRLVESWVLVQKHKGLYEVKRTMMGVDLSVRANGTGYSDYELRVKQAIADVESCI